jgi:hypothetical protein
MCYRLILARSADENECLGTTEIRGRPFRLRYKPYVYRRTIREHARSRLYVAAPPFNSKGAELEKTRAGLYRLLLHQMLRENEAELARVAPPLLASRREFGGDNPKNTGKELLANRLEDVVYSLLTSQPRGGRTFILSISPRTTIGLRDESGTCRRVCWKWLAVQPSQRLSP